MTLDPTEAVREVGEAWRTSPMSFIFGSVMLISTLSAFYVAWVVVTWSLDVSEGQLEQSEALQQETLALATRSESALATFEERQKIFRDWVREQTAARMVVQEANEAEFWAAQSAMTDLIEFRTVEILERLEAITEQLEAQIVVGTPP